MLSSRTCDCAQFVDFYLRLILCLDLCIGSSVTCDTTGVERTEGQLRTRLTNGLCGDDTNSLTLLYHALSGKVTSITFHADTLLALTSEDRTDLDAFNATTFNLCCNAVSDFLTTCNDEFVGLWIDNIVN